MLHIAICDDDSKFLKLFKNTIIENCIKQGIDYNIDCFSDGLALVENYNKYNLIFLDIDMPMIDGIETCKRINSLKAPSSIPFVVFVTSKDNLVFDALKEYPFTFIRKFELREDICACLSKVNAYLPDKACEYYIKDGRKITVINLDEVILLEKYKNYTAFHTVNKIYKERSSINEKEEDLKDKGFIRISIGCIVNARYIQLFDSERIYLKNKRTLLVSRKYRESAKKLYYDWLVKKYV